MDIEEAREIRFKFLYKVWERTDGNTINYVNMWKIGEELDLNKADTQKVYHYLSEEYLLKMTALGGTISITHEGIKEIEDALSRPETPTEYFPPVNVINIDKMINSNIQQGVSNASQEQTINQNKINKIKEFTKNIEEKIDRLGLTNEQISDLKAELNTLKSQLESSKPSKKILGECLQTTKQILQQATVAVLRNALIIEASKLLGLIK